MLNGAYQTGYFVLHHGYFVLHHGYLVLHHGVLACYASEPTLLSEGAPQYKGCSCISCCGLKIEHDTGENDNGRSCFTTKALWGSTRRKIELACDTVEA